MTAVTALEDASDAHLVAISANDPRAFGELVRRHQAFVYGAALRVVRNPTRAEDIAQEAFLRAFRALDQFRGEADVRGWLYRIARNVALNSVTRSREVPRAEIDTPPTDRNPESEYLRRHSIDLVREAITELPRAMREPLILREYEDLSYEDIADRLDIPLNTVRTRIFRAKRALERALEHSS